MISRVQSLPIWQATWSGVFPWLSCVTATNELQQPNHLSMQQVREGPAIYYLAQFQFEEGKYLRFDFTVYPEGAAEGLKHRFSQALYN